MSFWVLIAGAIVVMAAVLIGNGIVRQRGEPGLTNRALAGIAAGLALAVAVVQIGGGLFQTTPSSGQAQPTPSPSESVELPTPPVTLDDDDVEDDDQDDDEDPADAGEDTSPTNTGPVSDPEGALSSSQGAAPAPGNSSSRQYATGTVNDQSGTVNDQSGIVNGNSRSVSSNAAQGSSTNKSTIARAPRVTISSKSLPSATVYEAYRTRLRATGGGGSYKWKLVSGKLPTGIKLSSSGLVSGTTKSAGTATFTVKVTAADGSTARRSFTLTSRLMVATQVSVGYGYACALTTKGGVKCWGMNLSAQMGLGYPTIKPVLTPRSPVGLAKGVKAVAAGDGHACALTTAGGVKCWGSDVYGQIGDGLSGNGNPGEDDADEYAPRNVVGLSSGVAAISAGITHTCALTTAGGVKCWGDGQYGQLGNGKLNETAKPVNVIGLSTGVKQIAVGYYHSCAVLTAGGVKCWGEFGTVDESTEYVAQPRRIPLSSNIARVSKAGFEGYACGVTTTGGALCWGDNRHGGIGNGTTDFAVQPTPVVGLSTGVSQIATGIWYGCAVTSAGAARCWGQNELGQLGNRGTQDASTPTNVYGLSSGVRAISAYEDQTCALLTNGGIRCWGWNLSGALGTGVDDDKVKPAPVRVQGFR